MRPYILSIIFIIILIAFSYAIADENVCEVDPEVAEYVATNMLYSDNEEFQKYNK